MCTTRTYSTVRFIAPPTTSVTMVKLSMSLLAGSSAISGYNQETIPDKVKKQKQVTADFLKKFKPRY